MAQIDKISFRQSLSFILADLRNLQLTTLYWILVASFFFTFSGFGFLDVLAIRRPFQSFALSILVVFGLVQFLKRFAIYAPDFVSSIFLCYTAIYVLISLLLRNSILEAANGAVVLFVILLLNTTKAKYRIYFMRSLIAFSFIFALAGIIEFVILIFQPDLIKYTGAPGNALYLSNTIQVTHPINYLGLTTGVEKAHHSILGIPLTRMRSFLYEPSLAIAYFLLPGGISLLFEKPWRKIGYMLIFFSLLTFSGSVIMSILFGIVSFLIVRLSRSRSWMVYFPFIFATILSLLSFAGEFELFLKAINIPGQLIYEYFGSDIFIKTTSASARLQMIKDAYTDIFNYPIGKTSRSDLSVGTFWLSYIISSPLGFLLNLAVMFNIFTICGKLSIKTHSIRKNKYTSYTGLSLVYGVLFSSFTFTSYGFTNAFGLMWIYLTYMALKDFNLNVAKTTV